MLDSTSQDVVAQGIDMALEQTGRKGVFIRCDLRGNQALFESGFGQDTIGFNEDCAKRLIIFLRRKRREVLDETRLEGGLWPCHLSLLW